MKKSFPFPEFIAKPIHPENATYYPSTKVDTNQSPINSGQHFYENPPNTRDDQQSAVNQTNGKNLHSPLNHDGDNQTEEKQPCCFYLRTNLIHLR